ncbi:MAG: mechanosensitive ion channel family protein [Proteobacteria bacterium]|nr:mechanosensitive ion channel family protein [Pseudomonadota bacterium]
MNRSRTLFTAVLFTAALLAAGLGSSTWIAPAAAQPQPAGSAEAPGESPSGQDSKAQTTAPAAPVPASPTTSPAAAPTSKAAAAPGPEEQKTGRIALPPVEDEVRGQCQTPRQAYLQLLYWLQKGQRWNPVEAARCFDTSQLADPARAPRLAEMLKTTLDSRNARIKDELLPMNPDYRDNETGLHLYRDPTVRSMVSSDIVVVKDQRTGRWQFSPETLDAVPDLYPSTGVFEDVMPSWLRAEFLNIEIWKYLALVLLYLLAQMVKWMVVFVFSRYVLRIIQRTKIDYLDQLISRAQRPLGLLVQAIVYYVGVPFLLLPLRINELLMVVINAMAAFAGVWLSYRLIDVLTDYMMSRAEQTQSKLDDQLVPMVAKTLKVFVSVVGGIFILQNLDVNVGSLLAGLGLGGLAFALAAKDTIANFFGSLMIFIDKPFQIGDWVVIGSTEGIVEEVGFRTSRVRTFYNSLITVPNSLVTNAMIDNYGARQYRRYVANLGLCYDTPPDKVEAFCEGLRAIVSGMPGMRKDYYLVEFKEFGSHGLIIMLYCFMDTATWNDELRVRTNLNLEIMRLADNLGVGFAYPTQTLHVASVPKQGESRPSHSGPNSHPDLRQVIEGFGPGGSLARPKGLSISKGYDCDQGSARGSDDDG